ncbi:hypothetical protein PG997_001394 [Apiospora hydei]|uniref:Uncharacterized protein n=1 Tax=Apiospora hydei TaxID=1337664 RepID=A0ABR1XDK1_9PEZI
MARALGVPAPELRSSLEPTIYELRPILDGEHMMLVRFDAAFGFESGRDGDNVQVGQGQGQGQEKMVKRVGLNRLRWLAC